MIALLETWSIPMFIAVIMLIEYIVITGRRNALKRAKNNQILDVIRLASHILKETLLLHKNEDFITISNWLYDEKLSSLSFRPENRISLISDLVMARSNLANSLFRIIDETTNLKVLDYTTLNDPSSRTLIGDIDRIGVLLQETNLDIKNNLSYKIANGYYV